MEVESITGRTSFEDLEVWKRSCDLVVEVCSVFREFRDYGLRDQISRSALSIPSNIAEGAERISRKEFIQFLGYAKGSVGELRTQLMIANRLGYITAGKAKPWIAELRQISTMIYGLAKSLES